jgi:AraC-like DNA-binding protein
MLLGGPRPTGAAGVFPAEWLVVFLVVLNVAQIVRMLFGHVVPVRAVVPVVITLELVIMVAVIARRAVGWPGREASGRLARRYARSGLDRPTALELLTRVEQALSRDRLFTDPELTLGRLAAAVDSTPHQVSEALNRYANTTFAEIVCRYRIEDVKAQLSDPAADGYSIEGIGGSAGFRSRSALYAAFRRAAGMTPAEFRARRAKVSS